jgi:lipoate-protein ligase A
MTCRLLIDPPADGAWNMAVDEALLESAALDKRLTLRFYRWSEPTLSLGYFQRFEDRRQHAASLSCDCVRRLSGGGAILHDRELTYSLAVPPSHPLTRSPEQIYQAVHGSLFGCLREFGFDAALVSSPAANDPQPFLCFHRRALGDVVIGSHKIAGSAQRRWRGAVLQHGSILLAASPAAPELPGLNDLAGSPLAVDAFISLWRGVLPGVPTGELSGDELTVGERTRAAEIAASKYGQAAWTERR